MAALGEHQPVSALVHNRVKPHGEHTGKRCLITLCATGDPMIDGDGFLAQALKQEALGVVNIQRDAQVPCKIIPCARGDDAQRNVVLGAEFDTEMNHPISPDHNDSLG